MKINWKIVIASITSTLTVLAALPYSIGDLANIIPSQWKGYVVTVGLISTVALRIWNANLTPPSQTTTTTATVSVTTPPETTPTQTTL